MRDAILQAMREMLVHHHRNPTLDEVATTVGITTRTVQDYFTSPTAIENALIAHLDPDTSTHRCRSPNVHPPKGPQR